jgi:E3 ubiquitin-protein ligase HERC1
MLLLLSRQQVWAALAVVGGADHGLRMGGRCVHRESGRHATILGLLKEDALLAKVLWDDSEATVGFVC